MSGSYLLLRRGGGVWGVASAAVTGVERRAGGYRIALDAGGTLVADELLGMVGSLSVRPLAKIVRRFWPEATSGIAVHDQLPVLLLDPRRPPRALCEEEENEDA